MLSQFDVDDYIKYLIEERGIPKNRAEAHAKKMAEIYDELDPTAKLVVELSRRIDQRLKKMLNTLAIMLGIWGAALCVFFLTHT